MIGFAILIGAHTLIVDEGATEVTANGPYLPDDD